MTDELLINVGPFETRVALVSDGRPSEIFVERRGAETLVGNVYLGRVVRVLPGIGGAFVDLGIGRTGFLPGHAASASLEGQAPARIAGGGAGSRGPLEEGAPVVVQVRTDALAAKGPRLTTNITLPGRYLVFAPLAAGVRVSRQISEEAEHTRLADLVASLAQEGEGFIVRTAASRTGRSELEAEVRYLRELWAEIESRRRSAEAPLRLHEELDAPLRVLRDDCPAAVERVLIDSQGTFEKAQRFCERYMPELAEKLVYFQENVPIFELYDIESALFEALKPEVALPSGGRLVIETTEALTAIDVDSGRYVAGRTMEQTSFLTNLAAAREIASQLRLRNIGGLIVVDFIAMEDPGHRAGVMEALREELARDRVPNRAGEMSPLGLVEITRKRGRPSLLEALTEACAACAGTGRSARLAAVAGEIVRAAAREARAGARAVAVVGAPEVVAWLAQHGVGTDAGGGEKSEIDAFVRCGIELRAEAGRKREEFEVIALS